MSSSQSALVLVVGDLGRSPRMLNHIARLLSEGYFVECIAYDESPVPGEISGDPSFALHSLSSLCGAGAAKTSIQNQNSRILYLIQGIWKSVWTFLSLLILVFFCLRRKPALIINQNPPAIPILGILPLAAWFYGAHWTLDWHNLGFSIMAMTAGERSLLVRLARLFELGLGRLAHSHLTVTRALRDFLVSEGFSKASVAVQYDKACALFRRSTPEETRELLERLPSLLSFSSSSLFGENIPDLKNSADLLGVSATSWTLDEDFSLLLEAIGEIERQARPEGRKINILITGKGPQQSAFMRAVEERQSERPWRTFWIGLVWLPSYSDYARLLGGADFGLSLHRSSSGLDFPMKIIDMLASGPLPVLSADFPTSGELLPEAMQPLVFRDCSELSQRLRQLDRLQLEALRAA